MNKTIYAIIVLNFIWIQSFLFAVEIKPLRQITLSEEGGIIIERGFSFIVTEDDKILVTDMKASNIKFFDMSGKRINIFGRKGAGPNEFIRPLFSTYKEPFVAFLDIGRSMFFIYKRSGPNGLEFYQRFLAQNLAPDFKFIDTESILIAGDKRDKNNRPYSLCLYNIKEKKYNYILPSEIAYGCASRKQFEKDNNERLGYIGYSLFFDFSDTDVYLVWQGSNEVIKINRKTKELMRFGKKTEKYVKPYYTSETVSAFNQRNHRLLYKLNRSMSIVQRLFVTNSGRIGVVYTGPYKKDGSLPVMLQLYNASGKYLKEVELLKAKASHHYEVYFYFKKSNNRFYIMDTETSEEFDQTYKIHEFQVEE